MRRSPYIPITADELCAFASGRPYRVIVAPAMRQELEARIARVEPYRGRYVEGYRSALAEILDLLDTEE